MQILEHMCTECKGNVVLDVDEGTLTCEDCGHIEQSRKRSDIAAALEHCIEYGPKEKRYKPSTVGKLFIHPQEGLAVYLRETLLEAVRGLDMEDYDLRELRRWGLLEDKEE